MTIAQENGVTVLIPTEGMYLTNGTTYSDKVYLGRFDSAENWTEVDEIPAVEDEEEISDGEALSIITGGGSE